MQLCQVMCGHIYDSLEQIPYHQLEHLFVLSRNAMRKNKEHRRGAMHPFIYCGGVLLCRAEMPRASAKIKSTAAITLASARLGALKNAKAKRCSFYSNVVRENRALCKKQTVPSAKESTEPSKRLFNYNLAVLRRNV